LGDDVDGLPKVSIGIITIVIAQIGGFIWWTAQQASTIANLQETVTTLTIENNATDRTNLIRDVEENQTEINDLWQDSDEVWDEVAALALSINAINEIKQRIALLENELKYVNRDHNMMIKSGE
jgi:predicted RNase H-like nuclease (RuvC/YqgF family)